MSAINQASPEEATQIIMNAINLAQKRGAYTLQESAQIHSAITVLENVGKNKEIPKPVDNPLKGSTKDSVLDKPGLQNQEIPQVDIINGRRQPLFPDVPVGQLDAAQHHEDGPKQDMPYPAITAMGVGIETNQA